MSKISLPPDSSKRTITPRRPKYTHRGIIALDHTAGLVEHSGVIFEAKDLPKVLLTEPSSIIVCEGFGQHLDLLRKTFKDNPTFQYRVTPRHIFSRNNDDGRKQHPVRIHDAVCNYVGFRGFETDNMGSGKKWTRYHYPVDPVHFVRKSIQELYDNQQTLRLQKLVQFGKELRNFCECQKLEIRPSAGGIATQLLRDSRFYPEPRRKTPRLINDTVRCQLPGNYYRLLGSPDPKRYTAGYLDMSNAHHEMAKRIEFPCTNGLHAFGRWVEEESTKSYISYQSKTVPNLLLARPGLFHLQISVPCVDHRRFLPPYLERPGTRSVWVYSNELELIEEAGAEITGIYAAFISSTAEVGLNRYAEWAIEQITTNPSYKPWLKPTLHSTYGILAARPIPFETAFFRAKGDVKPVTYPMGRVSIPGKAKQATKIRESSIVNVLHRGMIEAEVRKEVLSKANEFRSNGYNVIALYADSIFIEGEQMPLLPHPWRLSEICTNLRFYSPTHFESDQESRFPGIPRNVQEKNRHEASIRTEVLLASFRSAQDRHSKTIR